jgi:hypothetical protein
MSNRRNKNDEKLSAVGFSVSSLTFTAIDDNSATNNSTLVIPSKAFVPHIEATHDQVKRCFNLT